MEKQMYRKFMDNLDGLSNSCRRRGTFEVANQTSFIRVATV